MSLTKEDNYELHFLKLALPDWETLYPASLENFTNQGFCNYFQNKHHIRMGVHVFRNRFPTLYSFRTIFDSDVTFWYNRYERRAALKAAINKLEKKK